MRFASRVIHGQKHGRTIGYPTANLEVTVAVRQALDKEGVYAVRVDLDDKKYSGALFYGRRSLFKDNNLVCEVLLIDFVGELYDQEITVDVVEYIRPVVLVKSEEELKRLIEEDILKAKFVNSKLVIRNRNSNFESR